MDHGYNIEAEKDFLSILLNNHDAIVDNSDKISSFYFFDPFHQKIISKIKENIISDLPVEISTLSNNKREQIALNEIKLRNKSINYLHTFFNILEECYLARSLKKISDNINRELEKDNETNQPSKVLNSIRAIIEDISKTKTTTICEAKELIQSVLNDFHLNYEEAQSGLLTRKKGIIETPFSGLNCILKKGGYVGGSVIIVAARPSIGKTEFALNCAAHSAIKDQKNVFVYSLEMGKQSLLERILLYDSQVPSDVLESGKRTENQWKRVISSAEKIKQANLMFEENLSGDIFDIITSIRKANNKNKLELVIIDYLQLIQYSGVAGTRNDELSAISRAIKQESVRLNIPIIALSQLSRKHLSEGREPDLVDLRDSGTIEQDADVVVMLHATEKEKANKELTKTKAMIRKQREGSIGEFFLLNKKLVQTFVGITESKHNERPQLKEYPEDDLPF